MSYQPHEVEWTPEKVARVWDFYGANPAMRAQYFSAHSGGAIAKRVDEELALRGKRVLDFGCGKGDLLAHLYEQEIPAAGLEFSRDSATECVQRFVSEPLCRGITLAETLPSPLEEGAYDVVFLVEVVEHLLEEQVAPTLAEVRRLLAPGGHVAVTMPNAEDRDAEQVRCPDCGATFHRWQHVRSLDPAGLAALFAEHGFEARVSEGVNWFDPPRAVWKARLLRRPLPLPHLLYVGSTAGAR